MDIGNSVLGFLVIEYPHSSPSWEALVMFLVVKPGCPTQRKTTPAPPHPVESKTDCRYYWSSFSTNISIKIYLCPAPPRLAPRIFIVVLPHWKLLQLQFLQSFYPWPHQKTKRPMRAFPYVWSDYFFFSFYVWAADFPHHMSHRFNLGKTCPYLQIPTHDPIHVSDIW